MRQIYHLFLLALIFAKLSGRGETDGTGAHAGVLPGQRLTANCSTGLINQGLPTSILLICNFVFIFILVKQRKEIQNRPKALRNCYKFYIVEFSN